MIQLYNSYYLPDAMQIYYYYYYYCLFLVQAIYRKTHSIKYAAFLNSIKLNFELKLFKKILFVLSGL